MVFMPRANCAVCGRRIDDTVDIVEVQIGTATYRACADECVSERKDRQTDLAERRAGRGPLELKIIRVVADRNEGGEVVELAPAELERLIFTPGYKYVLKRVVVDPRSAANVSAPEVVSWVRVFLHYEAGGRRSPGL